MRNLSVESGTGTTIREFALRALVLSTVVLLANCLAPSRALAGPPFVTDDPEPVEYKHWEVYLATDYERNADGTAATLPLIEVNYGVIPDVQLHVIAPMAYESPKGESDQYGYGDTEVGFKYLFIHETDAVPQAGIFPLLEIPTGDEDRGLGSGNVAAFIPLWLQKSWGSWTSYGGLGYGINPGSGNKNSWLFGWQVQRDITEMLTLGAEVFHETSDEVGGDAHTGFNAGGFLNFGELHHVLFSAGRDFSGSAHLTGYFGYQLTFGP